MERQPAPRTVTASDRAARRGRQGRYTREQIARAALELVDRAGLKALTMHRLAETLEAGTMTLYSYFESRDDLLNAVVDVAVEEAELPPRAGSWREQLAASVEAAARAVTRHPALAEIRNRAPILRHGALGFAERVIAILRGAGFAPEEAAAAFRLIFTYTFGFALLSPERSRVEASRAAALVAAQLPDTQFPNLTAVADAWSRAMAGGEAFDYGLACLLDGLDAQLRSAADNRGERMFT